MKECKKCGIGVGDKDISSHFYSRIKKGRTYYTGLCKTCYLKQEKDARESDKEHWLEINRQAGARHRAKIGSKENGRRQKTWRLKKALDRLRDL